VPVAVTLTLPRDPSALAAARRAVKRHCDGLLQAERLGDLQLVLTELVSNALVHGRGEIVLRLDLDGHLVRGEVIDQGDGFEHELRVSGPEEVGGRGLMLVKQLTSRWGTYVGTTHVWFELSADPEHGEPGRTTS
jgi:anti-sigma regulatory factor (Ser/Thr protein kinase)